MCDEYSSLVPKAKTAMYISNCIKLAVWWVIAVSVFILIKDQSWYDVWYAVLIFGISAIVTLYLIIGPIVFYKYYRYLVNSEKIDVRRGIVTKRRELVPIERIHQVEIQRGPILNLLGLANVEVMTAGGTAWIEYLELDVAESIADELNAKVNSIIRDRSSE